LAQQAPNVAESEAAIVQIDNTTFSQKLEKHISDYNAGVGYLSARTGNQLLDKGETLASQLDPRSLRAYLGYTTAFSYDNKARFINGTADAIGQLSQILRKA